MQLIFTGCYAEAGAEGAVVVRRIVNQTLDGSLESMRAPLAKMIRVDGACFREHADSKYRKSVTETVRFMEKNYALNLSLREVAESVGSDAEVPLRVVQAGDRREPYRVSHPSSHR